MQEQKRIAGLFRGIVDGTLMASSLCLRTGRSWSTRQEMKVVMVSREHVGGGFDVGELTHKCAANVSEC